MLYSNNFWKLKWGKKHMLPWHEIYLEVKNIKIRQDRDNLENLHFQKNHVVELYIELKISKFTILGRLLEVTMHAVAV